MKQGDTMVPIKIECGCGQHYAFDVEPDNGRMPTSVACPECGMDGTDAANDGIAQYLSAQPEAPDTGLREAAASPAPSAPPPPISAAPTLRPPGRQTPPQKHDGWGSPETSFNKLGTYLMAGSAVLAALTAWGMFGIEISGTILCIIVGVCGVVGGAINLAGRGPILAGMIIGPIIGLGGFGAALWWMQGRQSIRKIEISLAFIIGAAPGFLLQYLLQKRLKKRAEAGE
jgi:hypothetical protein